MARSGALRRYWSGVNNVHDRLNSNNKDGKEARKLFKELTGNKIYTEKNFNLVLKGKGKPITKKEVRKGLKEIRNKKRKMLKEEYKALKDRGVEDLASEEDFIKSNLKDDLEYQDLRELYNSV